MNLAAPPIKTVITSVAGERKARETRLYRRCLYYADWCTRDKYNHRVYAHSTVVLKITPTEKPNFTRVQQ